MAKYTEEGGSGKENSVDQRGNLPVKKDVVAKTQQHDSDAEPELAFENGGELELDVSVFDFIRDFRFLSRPAMVYYFRTI